MSFVTSEISKLKGWIHSNSTASYDFLSASKSMSNAFIPDGVVEEHFQTKYDNYRRTNSLLLEVFNGGERVSAKTVSHKCCRVMCILVLVGRPELITTFVANDALYDEKLPFDTRVPPPDFPEPNKDGFYVEFVKHQWRFFAPIMENRYGWDVKEDRILPFIEGWEISDKPGSKVYKLRIHASHDKLFERTVDTEPNSHWYALKTFIGKDAERHFERESLAFMNITAGNSVRPAGMIGFFQSFQYRKTFNILLEYADNETLETFFSEQPRPSSGAEIIEFWESLLTIVKGVCILHRPKDPGRGASVEGWHQDLKPENILVTTNHKPHGYRWDFKVADLALCHFKTIIERRGNEKPLDWNALGTRTYAAPECFGESAFTQFMPTEISNQVDVWSLGCVLAEVCIWVVRGITGLQTFRNLRRRAAFDVPDLRKTDCFHDKEDLLPDLESQLHVLKDECHSHDFITAQIVDRLVLAMLSGDANTRLTAPQVQSTVEKILPRAKTALGRVSTTPESRATETAAVADPGSGAVAQTRVLLGSSDQTPGKVIEDSALVHSPEGSRTPNDTSNLLASAASVLSIQTRSAQTEASRMQSMSPENNSAVHEHGWDPARLRSETLQSTLSDTSRLDSRGTGDGVVGARDARPDSAIANTREVLHEHRTSENSLEMINSPEFDKNIPYVSVERAFEYFHDKKDDANIRVDPLPHMNLLSNLEGRDQVFIIDDSLGMKKHKKDVKALVRLLAWLTKHYDKDKLELFFLSSDERCESTSSRRLAQAVETRRFDSTTDLSKRFGELLQKYGREIDPTPSPLRGMFNRERKQPKKKSIYVFTDGKLETGDAEQGHEEIKALIVKIRNAGLMRDQVGIQFISFGDDQVGLQRLQRLDHLARTAGLLPFDIVDTEPSTGNVLKILLGGFKPRFDRDQLAVATPVSPTPGSSAHP